MTFQLNSQYGVLATATTTADQSKEAGVNATHSTRCQREPGNQMTET